MPYTSQDKVYKSAGIMQREAYNKKRREELAEIEKLEEETKQLEYKLWSRGLKKEEAVSILGHDKIGSEIAQRALKSHFLDILWPEKRMLIF